MDLTKTIRLISPFILSFSLISCGGGGFTADSTGSSDNTTTSNTSSNPNTGGGTTTVLSLGKIENSIFTAGQLKIGLSNLSAGGSTGITATLVDQNGDLATGSKTVIFSSACIASGKAQIQPPPSNSTGVFTTTYIATGCEGTDIVTATVDSLSATGTINVQPANLGAVEFVSASPETILLQNMSAPGLQHTSVITFQIKNDVGGPIEDADVTFELSTSVGGITLSATQSKTDANGIVSTILQAGTVHTSVRVKATVQRNGETISSESSQLIISTGIADQNSFSMSISDFNPAAYNHDGVEVSVSIIASDRYNNPVPDGTTVSFYTELGQIAPSCQTITGRCSVKWISSDPRDLGITDIRYPHDSITTITAKVIGEESFIDTNSNGIFDDGDLLDTISDKGEAFEDYNKGYTGNGIVTAGYDQGLEPYIDFNSNGSYDPKDGKYTGLGCLHSTLCANAELKDIYASSEVVLSENTLIISVLDQNDNPVTTINNDIPYKVRVYGASKKQVPPSGTSITVTSDEAEVLTGFGVVPKFSFHGTDSTSPFGFYQTTLEVKDKDSASIENGTIKIQVSDASNTSINLNYVDQ